MRAPRPTPVAAESFRHPLAFPPPAGGGGGLLDRGRGGAADGAAAPKGICCQPGSGAGQAGVGVGALRDRSAACCQPGSAPTSATAAQKLASASAVSAAWAPPAAHQAVLRSRAPASAAHGSAEKACLGRVRVRVS